MKLNILLRKWLNKVCQNLSLSRVIVYWKNWKEKGSDLLFLYLPVCIFQINFIFIQLDFLLDLFVVNAGHSCDESTTHCEVNWISFIDFFLPVPVSDQYLIPVARVTLVIRLDFFFQNEFTFLLHTSLW